MTSENADLTPEDVHSRLLRAFLTTPLPGLLARALVEHPKETAQLAIRVLTPILTHGSDEKNPRADLLPHPRHRADHLDRPGGRRRGLIATSHSNENQ
jgi:hypothetical protein